MLQDGSAANSYLFSTANFKSRTLRHGVHLARRPCRFPGQKRAETLCWWLPLPCSVSNKALTCFSNKRPEVVKSRCPVPKCSIIWHQQTTTCFCSHILKEKMVQHVPMYYAYVHVYVHVYLYVQYISLESYAGNIYMALSETAVPKHIGDAITLY